MAMQSVLRMRAEVATAVLMCAPGHANRRSHHQSNMSPFEEIYRRETSNYTMIEGLFSFLCGWRGVFAAAQSAIELADNPVSD
eukprot:5299968-Pyramimonas_sp.AAC.2